MSKLNLHKTVKEKNQYKQVIDTSFTQLVSPPTPEPQLTTDQQISEFFTKYEELFYDIPKSGDLNSHEYIIKQSSEYIDYTPIDNDVQALLDEIASLRKENLELQQQIVDLSINGK